MKRNFDILLIVLLAFPLLFINLQHSTDWGGDFAMYINEAMNIVHLQPVAATHYVFNENAPMLGPKAYPVGFPLLLSPVCLIFGNNISIIIIFMALLLILLAIVLYIFFKTFFSKTVSLILVLVIIYNPWTLHFKNDILSDIPFTLFFVLTIILFIRKAPVWLTGLLMGISILIKTAGFVLPAGFSFYFIYLFITQHKQWKINIKKLLLPVGYALFFVFIINKIIFHFPSGISLYAQNFSFNKLEHNALVNISLYINIFQSFFFRNLHDWKFIMLITQSSLFTFTIVGILNSKKNVILFILSTYLLMLFFYPYHSAGFRFLLPVMPLLLYYAVNGFKSIHWNFTIKKELLVSLFALFLLGQYIPEIITLSNKSVKILSGPQEKTSQEVFNFIKDHIEKEATILFTKPRVLALYTKRNSTCNKQSNSTVEISRLFKEKNIEYILTCTELPNQTLNRYLIENRKNTLLIWNNKKFKVYKVIGQE